jgi:hypothetical protein
MVQDSTGSGAREVVIVTKVGIFLKINLFYDLKYKKFS